MKRLIRWRALINAADHYGSPMSEVLCCPPADELPPLVTFAPLGALL